MADIRTVAELVTQGAQKFVQDYISAQQAVTNLTTKLNESNRVSTSQLSASVEATRAAIQKLGTDGAQGVKELNAALDQLANKLESVGRIRTPQLASNVQAITDALKASAAKTLGGEAGVASNLRAIQGTQVAQFADTSIASRQAQALAEALAEAQRIAAQAAAAHAATLQGRLQVALSSLGTTLGRTTGLFHQTTIATQQATQAATANAAATVQQAAVLATTRHSSVTYLSVLSAVHAASFLASNRTFTLAGSFVTLGLAFGKAGIAAGVAGLALGGLLFIFNRINQAAELLQQTLLGAAQGLITVAGIAGAAVTAAGAAGVKIAADVETSLAGLRAFGGATAEQLREASAQSTELAIRFGVSAREILEGASLFVRAGGNVVDAIGGATEAIVKLTVASQGELQAAQAALAVSQGLRAFNLEGKEAARVADVVTGAVQSSALSFTGFTQAFIQAAPGARNLGFSLEDLAATLAFLSNELVKGTITGTSLKQELLDLVNPAKKSRDELERLGISIEDQTGAIRPWIDILTDLNRALGDQAVAEGRTTEAARARSVAIIFESRAGLAGAITAREGAAALEKFRAKLEEVTATDVVNVLLLPLNKQFERLKVVVEEVGRAFGESLLSPIRAVVASVIGLFSGMIDFARLAGQAVGVVLTGQGFEALQTKITDLVGNNALSSFLIELVNSFRNVVDVIQNAIIPAIIDFGTRLGLVASEEGRLEDLGKTFDAVNRTIQIVGRTVAGLITGMAELAVQIVHNEGEGKRLRDTLGALVTKVLAGFLATVVSLVPAIAAAAAAMPIFARANILVAQIVIRLIDVFKQFELKMADIAELAVGLAPFVEGMFGDNKTKEAADRLNKQLALTRKFAGEMREEIGKTFDVGGLTAQIDAFGGTVEGLEGRIRAFSTGTTVETQAALIIAEAQAEQANRLANEAVAAFDEVGTEGARLQAEAAVEAANTADAALNSARRDARGFVAVWENAGGAISDAFANIVKEVEKSQSSLQRDTRGGTAGVIAGVDPEAVKRATDKVTELARDMNRKLANLAEDTATKTGNIVEKGLERLKDIFDKARQQIIDIGKDAQDQINDIFTNIGQRRLDRQRTDALKDQLDKQLENKQKELDNEARAEERALDRTRTRRQRDNEDNSRVLDEQFSDLERVLQRSQDASERAARRVQQVREDALKATQDAEERNLSRSLDAQATARREQQQLAEAKTPEERARVQAQIQAARTEAQFSRQQEDQLSALRKRHEAQQRALTEQNELQNIAFKQGQENQLLNFRKNNEKTLLIIRRNLDDQERGIREREEDTQLANRERRERQLQTLRRGHEQELRNLQDRLENEAAVRQANNIIKRARERAEEIITNAVKQALEQQTAIEQQLTTQRQEIERSLRALNDQIIDFEENLPADVKSAILSSINALRSTLATGSAEIIRTFDEESVRLLSQFNTTIGLGEIDLRSNIPNLTIPTPNMPVQVTPRQVIQASVIQAAQLIIGQAAAQQLSNTFLGALRQADQEGITLDTPVDFNPVIGAINVTNNSLNLLRGIFGR